MCSHFSIKNLSPSVDQIPLHHLFSFSALDNDLTYVDKTYYASNKIDEADGKNLPLKPLLHLQSMIFNNGLRGTLTIARLNLRDSSLHVIPVQLAALTQLTYLDLSYNKIQQVPSFIDFLKQLRHLNLSHNQLRDLPRNLFSLTKLTYLNLSSNPLFYVSPNLARLTSLNVLDLSKTNITSLPAELLALSMTTIRTENCQHLLDRSFELNQQLTHNPISLVETCARQLLHPILQQLIHNNHKLTKKGLQKLKKLYRLDFEQLPNHLMQFISRPRACSSCGGVYFRSYVVRYRIVQRQQDDNWIPIEYRLCAAHWNTEEERLCELFGDKPTSTLPFSEKLGQLELLLAPSVSI